MAVENMVDSFYQLHVSKDGQAFTKLAHLTSCGVPNEAKVLDDVTATDDKRTVQAVVDFKEESELEFEYVLEPRDATQQMVQDAFDAGTELTFQIKFVNIASESRQFKGLIAELTTDNEDTKKKLRKKGKISITGEVTKIGV
nr:hypothetical protein [uncultured Moraxella sp.]